MLIINADDLGYDAPTNAAIMESFDRQLCSSATLLPNMQGFAEACELIHSKGLLEHIGIHLNLSEGIPLTEKIRRSARFCDDEGRFRLLRDERIWHLEIGERELLAEEIRAQIQQLKGMRLKLTHLDSHKNIHEEWGIFRTLLPLVKEAQIPFVRLSRNMGPASSMVRMGYRRAVNFRLRRLGLSRTRYFGSMLDYQYEHTRGSGGKVKKSCEIMIHPAFDEEGTLVDSFIKGPLEFKSLTECDKRSIVSYSQSPLLSID
jgi:chitin disaccharide deacetylase